MNWQEACNDSVNGKAKRDNGEDTWLIIDQSAKTISYAITDRGTGDRSESRLGPVARVLELRTDDDGEPVLHTKKIITVEEIEKYDDWRPSVPRPVVEEVQSLDSLEAEEDDIFNLDMSEEALRELVEDLDDA